MCGRTFGLADSRVEKKEKENNRPKITHRKISHNQKYYYYYYFTRA